MLKIMSSAFLLVLSSYVDAEVAWTDILQDDVINHNNVPTKNMAGIGFKFASDICVTHLGVFDINEDGLANPTEVGIYQRGEYRQGQYPIGLEYDGTLISSTEVQINAPLLNFFRYREVSPVTLFSDKFYSVVSNLSSENSAHWTAPPNFGTWSGPDDFGTAQFVKYLASHAFSADSLPQNLYYMIFSNSAFFRLSGNFQYTLGACPGSAPDPEVPPDPTSGMVTPKCLTSSSDPRCQVPIQMISL